MSAAPPGAATGLGAWRRTARELGAFWALDADCLARAQPGRGAESATGLRGVAVAVKDVLDVRGMPTTAGLPGHSRRADEDAAAVARLRAAGAAPVGKAAMDPLGWSTGGQAPGFPPCLNPVDRSLSPGGSSSGSAVAVAAGLCPLGLGTDLSGSLRIPAAYCGVVGFKPASGSIPSRGCLAAAPAFDCIGVVAADVRTGLAAYEALAAAPLPPSPGSLRVGVLEDLMEESDPAVSAACRGLLAAASEGPGFELRPARIEWRARGYARLIAADLERAWGGEIDRRPADFPDSIREDVARVRRVRPDQLERDRRDLAEGRASAARELAGVDVVASPTTPVAAPDRDAERTAVSVRFTRLYNALDWPALSVPCGRDPEGRPIGIQLAAPPARLGALVAAALRLESARPKASKDGSAQR